MFPSKHHKDDKDKGKDKGKEKDHKKPSSRKSSFFSAADKSGLAFVRKKTKDGKEYEITVEKTKPESRKSSHSHHDRDALPDMGKLQMEDDPGRYDARRHSQGGDKYGSYGSHWYLVRSLQNPGHVRGSGTLKRYTDTQYPDPEDRDVFLSDEDEESEVPHQDRRSHRGSSSYTTQPESYQSSRSTGPGSSVGTETLYERRRGALGHGDGHRDRYVYDDDYFASRDSISQRSQISGSSQKTIRPGDGSRQDSAQGYDHNYDSGEGYPPSSRHSISTRGSSESHTQLSRYSGNSSRYTDDSSRSSYASLAYQEPPTPGSSRKYSSQRAPSSSSSQSWITAPDSPYRPNSHAEVAKAEDRASLALRGTGRSSAGTADEVPTQSTGSEVAHRRRAPPATGFRPPSLGREGAYASPSPRFTGPDPFQFQVPADSTYSSDARSERFTGPDPFQFLVPSSSTSTSDARSGTGTTSTTSTSQSSASRGTATSTRSRTGTSIPSDSESDDTVTAYRREGKRGPPHPGSGSRRHHRRDSRGRDGGGGRGGSWIGSSKGFRHLDKTTHCLL